MCGAVESMSSWYTKIRMSCPMVRREREVAAKLDCELPVVCFELVLESG